MDREGWMEGGGGGASRREPDMGWVWGEDKLKGREFLRVLVIH